jgi:prepilin-type N-terminal cleavage/methylation domain-containing protein
MPSFIRSAYTLVELLVVVTIMVVLLALLAPAMDRAIYQAEMILCATTQRALGSSATLYATDFARRYPPRTGAEQWEYVEINKLASPSTSNYDLRPLIRGHIQVNKMFDCPFSQPVDWETTDPETAPYMNYGWWFGTQYRGHAGMMKLGDRFTWTWNGRMRAYDVMLGDYDVSEGQSSHPDALGVYVNRVYEDIGVVTGLFAGPDKVTLSVWMNPGLEPNIYDRRGPVDLNFLFQDQSSQRLDAVLPHDADLDRVPHRPSGNGWAGVYALIPRGR